MNQKIKPNVLTTKEELEETKRKLAYLKKEKYSFINQCDVLKRNLEGISFILFSLGSLKGFESACMENTFEVLGAKLEDIGISLSAIASNNKNI